jgi:hypothetical protein
MKSYALRTEEGEMKPSLRLLLTRQRRSLATIVVFVLVSHSAIAQDTLRPDKTDANLLCVTGTWAVWQTSELIESTREHRAQGFVHRLYRQRLSEPEAYLVHTRTDTRGPMAATVTKNGTVALVTRSRLSWHRRKGASVEEQTYPVDVAAMYPDGILRYASTTRFGRDTVFFVPFKNDRLDMTAEIKLISTRNAITIYSPIARHGSLLAWILVDVREGQVRNPTAVWDATLHVYDLESGKRRAAKLSVPLHKSYRATAFDGDVVMVHSYVFNARTGKSLNAVGYPKRPSHMSSAFAVRNRIGYYIHNKSLFAIDLLSKESPSIKLASVPKIGDCAQTASGIIVWNGKKWKTVPWLKEWPQSDR